MTAKHTPGPWGPHPRAHACVISSDEILIANCGGHSSSLRDQGELIAEQEANARLIAAAPELLEALKDLFDRANHHTCTEIGGWFTGNDENFETLRKAEQAIAKATGGAA